MTHTQHLRGTDPTTTRSVGDLVEELRSAQKPGAGVPAFTRYVNRRMGRYLAALAVRAGVGPDGVTGASAVLSFAAIAVIALVPPSPVLALVVTALLVLGYALDSADGQVARLTGAGSIAGEWLDHVVDAARHPALHLAVAISVFRFADVTDAWLVAPLAFTLVSVVRFFAQILGEQLRRAAHVHPAAELAQASGGSTQRLRSLIQLPSDTGLINLVFLLLPWPLLFLQIYTALLLCNTLLAAASLVRRRRELLSIARGEHLP